MKAILKLVRLSALPSAWADQLGGMALAAAVLGAGKISAARLPLLLLASFGIYLGGMALNDVLHVRKDRLLGKRRPIVTGELSLRAAWVVTLLLLALGVVGGVLAGAAAPVLLLVGLVFIYNQLAAGRIEGVQVRHPRSWTIAGVVVIAACRAIHVSLPLLAHAGWERLQVLHSRSVIGLFAGGVFVYFCLVTVVSLFEDSGGGRRAILAVTFLLAAPVLALPLWLLLQPGRATPVLGVFVPLGILAGLLLMLWRKLDTARKEPTPPNLGKTVGAGIRGECLLMAGFALMLAPEQPWWGFAALAMYPAAALMSKWISPT